MYVIVRAPSGPPIPVPVQRAWFRLVAGISRPRHRVARVAVDIGTVSAERVDGSADVDRRVVLYLHGGAYCLHSPRVYRRPAAGRPRCSPLFAELQGLPPTVIQAGSNDILLSDSTRLAQRLAAAGVDARLEVDEGMQHVFQDLPDMLPEAEAALGRIGAFLDSRWAA